MNLKILYEFLILMIFTSTFISCHAYDDNPRKINLSSDSALGWTPSELLEQDASKAIDRYFTDLDTAKFQDAYSMLNQNYKNHLPLNEFIAQNEKFNQLAGNLKARNITKITWTKDPKSAPYPGIYVSADLNSQFINIDRYCGYIVLYQATPTSSFEVMREEKNYLDNSTAQYIVQQRSLDYLKTSWDSLSKACPNYDPGSLGHGPTAGQVKNKNSKDAENTESWRFPTDKISKEQWQTYFDEVKAIPSVVQSTAPNQIILAVVAENTIYVFTTESHPAYPAVVKRQVQSINGSLRINRQGHYAGSKDAFDYWWHEFDALDAKIKNKMSSN